MSRLNIQRQEKLEPKRMDYCKQILEKLGFKVTVISSYQLDFIYKGNLIQLFPYSGWFQGKGIKSGRGLKKLLNQIN